MKVATASVAVLAVVFSVGAASACEWMKSNVTASVATPPASAETAAPATAIDPVLLAQLEKAAILPVAPKEEELPQVK